MIHKITHKKGFHISEGVYLAQDVSRILALPYRKVYHLMKGYWNSYPFGEELRQAVNFYSLIEFYVYFQCRQGGMSAQRFRSYHQRLSDTLQTRYPFAHHTLSTDFRRLWTKIHKNEAGMGAARPFDLWPILERFLHNISYGPDMMAVRYYPRGRSVQVVVDPRHQFGQPVVAGTNIRTKNLYSLHAGGETVRTISSLYNISVEKVQDAISFHTILS